MATTRWRGTRELEEQPDSPDFNTNSGGRRCIRTFHGPFEVCRANEPVIGTTMTGIPSTYKVEDVRTKPSPGGVGVMIVTLVDEVTQTGLTGLENEPPQYEVEMIEVETPLLRAPRYSAGGAMEITSEDDLAEVAKWEKAGRPKPSTFWGSGEYDNLIDYARKILKGVDTYVYYVPVARRTRRARGKPVTAACGYIDTPPAGCDVPAGYQWLKTADRGVRVGEFGRWVRVEEWTGAKEIDTDLYEEA